MKPTIYVQQDPLRRGNFLTDTIKTVVVSEGGEIVNSLTDDQDVEANVAVVSSIEAGLRALKETEHTIIFIYCLPRERDEVEAFASRYQARIKAWPIAERTGEENVMFELKRTVAKLSLAGAS